MSMTYRDLKEILDKFTPEQLDQSIVIFDDGKCSSVLDIVDRAWAENPFQDVDPGSIEQVLLSSEG
jgi:hypothetical protein